MGSRLSFSRDAIAERQTAVGYPEKGFPQAGDDVNGVPVPGEKVPAC